MKNIKKNENKAKGGRARANRLEPIERAKIAKKAAKARWGEIATHKGNFKYDFGVDVECYVLNDDHKTAVISQRGMGASIGFKKNASGQAFIKFVEGKAISAFLDEEILNKVRDPLLFKWEGRTVHGYDVTLLIDICKAIAKADENNKLLTSQKEKAQQAKIIIQASAKVGIQGLVYKLAGYDATREEVVAAFKRYVNEEAREYEKEFPNQLYQEWYRLYEIPKPKQNNPWKFMHLTNNQVYIPLAKSDGAILKLLKSTRGEERSKRLFQFLADIGVKALRQHLGQLLGIAKISRNKDEYESYLHRIFAD